MTEFATTKDLPRKFTFTHYGAEFICEVDADGNTVITNDRGMTPNKNDDRLVSYLNSGTWKMGDIIEARTKFRAGDKVVCIDSTDYGNFDEGDTLTVEVVRGNLLKFEEFSYELYRDEDFELLVKKPKLKLPLAITRSTGTVVVLTAGTVEGKVTMVYASGSNTLIDHYDESEALSNLEDGTWTVNGADNSAIIVARKAAVAEAEAELAAAQKALAAAEAAHKPYLA